MQIYFLKNCKYTQQFVRNTQDMLLAYCKHNESAYIFDLLYCGQIVWAIRPSFRSMLAQI